MAKSTLRPHLSALVLGAVGCRAAVDAPARPAPVIAAVIHVSPAGDDGAAGTAAHPVRTLERARDVARARRPGAVVELAAGDYVLSHPLELTARDDGTVYRAAPGARPRLVGGIAVTPLPSGVPPALAARLEPGARTHVVAVDLRRAGITNFGEAGSDGVELFIDGTPATLARWPDAGFAIIGDLTGTEPFEVHRVKGNRTPRFTVATDPRAWLAEPDLWFHGYWFWDWSETRERVQHIDAATRTVTLAPGRNHYGYRSGQRYYVYNALSELDAPGEWYLDRASGILVVWPPSAGAGLVVSHARALVTLTGASHVGIEGLTLEAVRGTAITIAGGDDNELRDCRIRNTGDWGIVVDGGTRHRVIGCEVAGVAAGGIRVRGGDRASLAPSGHRVERNHIHDYARLRRTLQPAISIEGVGVHVRGNDIHDAPHQAIAFAGNDHAITGNVIRRVCTETRDAGAIYAGRDWTMRGTEIAGNVFLDIRGWNGSGAHAVYLDDMFSGTTVARNVFVDLGSGVFIGGGRDNVVTGNVFSRVGRPVHVDARGLDWAAAAVGGVLTERLAAVPVGSVVWQRRYPGLDQILAHTPAAPAGNRVVDNLATASGPSDIQLPAQRYTVFERNLGMALR